MLRAAYREVGLDSRNPLPGLCEFLLKAVLLSYFGSFSSFPSKLRMFKELTFVEALFIG